MYCPYCLVATSQMVRKKLFLYHFKLLPSFAALREKNERVNEILREKLVAMMKVQIVDISKGLVQADGTISHHDLHDYLNLTNASSKKLFSILLDLLHQILNENEKEVLTPSE